MTPTDHEISGDHGDQLGLDGLTPRAGEQWVNVHTDTIGTIISVVQRNRTWVTLRRDGRTTTIPLSELYEHWSPMIAG